MDVDGAAQIGRQLLQQVHRGRPGRAQRMHGHAGRQRAVGLLLHRLVQGHHILGMALEGLLVRPQGRLMEARPLVQHRQQGQADADFGRRVDQRLGHGHRVITGPCSGGMAQVMELADFGVAAAQQLGIELGRHRPQLGRRDGAGHPVHAVAPAPEIVLALLAPLGQAGKGALEGVAVAIDQARQHRPGQDGGAGRRRGVGLDAGPAAVGTGFQQHGITPATGQPGPRCPILLGTWRVSHEGLSLSWFASSAQRARGFSVSPVRASNG